MQLMKLGLSLVAVVLLGGLGPRPAAALITPFSEDVYQATGRVAEWLRQQQQADGSWEESTGLAALCFLEQRIGPERDAPARGYLGLDEPDQARIRQAMASLIVTEAGLHPDGVPAVYRTGSALMALSVYLTTGGPDDVGAPWTVNEAITEGVNNLTRVQSATGSWCYDLPGCNDLSNVQFAAAGLSAASAVIPGAGLPLLPLRQDLTANREVDGGFGYRTGEGFGSSHAMTASGLWSSRLAGLPPSDPQVQRGLVWFRDHFFHDRQENWWQNSFYYYLWAATKGLAVSADDGLLPDGVFGDDVGGVRVPEEVDPRYQGEAQGWWFDFASLLLEEQLPEGYWPTDRHNGSNGYAPIPDAVFGCLALERSLGGVCLDQDEDGVCETQDRCPRDFDPDQADTDGDGVGDACDVCPLEPDPRQADSDGDRIGDACTKSPGCPGVGPEVCDGLDNDCDGRVDNVPEQGEICATGLPGVCALGRMACAMGQPTCLAVHREERLERCNGLDDDCDGRIDEELRNACGQCGALVAEQCNGTDDDCDGRTDEEATCPPGTACVAGHCAADCSRGGDCLLGALCVDGVCLPRCLVQSCPPGQRCDPTGGECFDPCADVQCEPGLHCEDGRCGTCGEVGCPAGQVCYGGGCVVDPCAAVACSQGAVCREGQCVPSCSRRSCALWASCVDGDCVADDCGGLECPAGQVCLAGVCGADPCQDRPCAAGQVCQAGRCRDDLCALTRCPPTERCDLLCQGDVCISRCLPGDLSPPVQIRDEDPPAEAEGRPTEGEGAAGPEAEGDEAEGQSPVEPTAQDDATRRTGDGCQLRSGTPASPTGTTALLFLLLTALLIGRGR